MGHKILTDVISGPHVIHERDNNYYKLGHKILTNVISGPHVIHERDNKYK